MGKFDAQARRALAQIKAKGALVTFTRDGAITDHVAQTAGVDTTYEAYMLGLPLSAGKARYLFGDGADITKPRLSVTIAMFGVTQTPRNGDGFTWAGQSFELLSMDPLDPAGDGAIIATGYAEAA